jgi:hypothetical protein
MSKKPQTNGQGQAKAKHATVVFGMDESGKPKAARFSPDQMQQATEAARSLKLDICEVNSDALQEVAKKLPSGRIYARGRAFIPFIKRDLYDQLLAARGVPVRNGTAAPSPAPTPEISPPPQLPLPFPQDWEYITPGSVVLAPEGPKDGWWEAVVLSRENRTLTLRYRDYPKMPKRVLDIHEVALLHRVQSKHPARGARGLVAGSGPSPIRRTHASARLGTLHHPYNLETTMPVNTDHIRTLNDDLRRHLVGGGAVMTPGIAALGPELVELVVKTLAAFDDFHHANDPYEEHDFGAFEVDGHRIFFKIDYFDKSLTHHSPDPADPNVTERIITIMLAEEY